MVTLDTDMDKELAKYPNQAETLRQAFKLYHGNITTDTVDGMRAAFIKLQNSMQEMENRFIEQYEVIEKVYNLITEMSNR